MRDYYDARLSSATPGKGQVAQATPYKPVPPGLLYLDAERFARELDERNAIRLSPFNEHEGEARQVVTVENAIEGLIRDPVLAAELMTEYAVRDAALIHSRGDSPDTFDCAVCRSGRYGIEDILARIPDLDD